MPEDVLRDGGALPREGESEGGRRPECLGQRLARTPDQGRPACARNYHSDAGSKPERRWVLLKIPRCDIDGVGEGK